jgi:hypothetical protein
MNRDGRGRQCPVCGKPTVEGYQPFCSSRCANVDLHRWLQGAYAIPAEEPPDEDAEGPDRAPGEPDPER